ncbi:MAG TPA: PKD domain-containing protein, partial [Vicinamibacterales bacterium]|nr:PKD domain-containing protein [Vicinamibacterales bacterium]
MRSVVACAAWCAAILLPAVATGGSLSAVAPSGVSPGVTIQITGSGFSATASRNEVHFVVGGSPPRVVASSVRNVDTTRKMVSVRVPDGLPVGTTPLRVVNLDTGEISEGRSIEIVALSLPSTAAASRGATNVIVDVQGTSNAQFSTTNTKLGFGAGVTVVSYVVQSPTSIRATVNVAATATLGTRTVTVLTTTQTVTLPNGFSVTDSPPPVNTAPTIEAGSDRSITRPATQVALTGTAADDGLPAGSTLAFAWSFVSGPQPVTFTAPNSADTTAVMSTVGVYVLQFTVTDGDLTSIDTLTVTVNPAPNSGPTVTTDESRSITLPVTSLALQAAVADDGYPEGSSLAIQWTQIGGPPGVTFSAPAAASTSVTFPGSGVYQLRVLASDGELAASATVSITVNPAPVTNTAPAVTATATPATVTLPADSVELGGTATDDGLPSPSLLTYAWQRVSGPLAVAFASASSRNTTVLFTEPGTYVLRLTANDGALSGSADVTVVVSPAPPPPPPPVNTAPVVSAAATPSTIALPTASVALTGTATDDGLPSGTLGTTWSKVSGPGAVSFTSANDLNTTAAFSASGIYVLRLQSSDGLLSASADVTITVNPEPPPPPPVNNAPLVAAGASPSIITLPASSVTLSATVTDDGRPNGTLSYRWSTASGPAAVSFDTATSAQTTARFTVAGTYVMRLVASDGQDSGAASVSVIVNPGAPPPPVNSPPQARPGGPYTGDATSVLTLSGSASSDPEGQALTYAWAFGDGATGSGPAPLHTYAQAGKYTVTLTVTDAEGATNSATTTATIGPPADRAPPAVTLTAPATALPGEEVLVRADAVDNIAVQSVAFTVNGGSGTDHPAAPYERRLTIPAVASPGTVFVVRAVALDPSNNSGAAEKRITVVAAPDSIAPTLSLGGPATASPGQAVLLIAEAKDDVGVASVRFVRGASTLVTSSREPFVANTAIPANAAVGSVVLFSARATDFAGNATEASHAVNIVAAPDTIAPTVLLDAPSSVLPGAVFDITADASDNAGVASVTFSIDGVSIATRTGAPYRASVTVPSTRGPGSVLSIQALATDTAGLTAAASATTIVISATAAAGLVTGEVYDDSTGLPLPGASVAVIGSASAAAFTDARGRFMVAGTGRMRLIVEKPGFSAVERTVDVPVQGVVEMIDARLTPLAAEVIVEPALETSAGGQDVRARLTAGSLAVRTSLRATRIGGQGLRGLLPPGWSPVAAVDLSPPGVDFAQPAELSARNLTGIGQGALLAVARWDDQSGAWRFVGTAVAGPQDEPLTATIDRTAQYVWLVPDVLPVAPPEQVADTLLTGVAQPSLPAGASVTVSPDPRIAVYSPDFRALVSAALNVNGPLSSGVLLQARLAERYDFVERPRVAPEPFLHDFVFYQFPGVATQPKAFFTVSPSVAFEPAALAEGIIGVEVRAPGGAALASLGVDGGRVSLPTGEAFTLMPGSTAANVAVRLERLNPSSLALDLPPSLIALGGALVSMGDGVLGESGVLAISRPQDLVDESGLVIARLEEIGGATRLRLVAIGRIAGNQIVSDVAINGLGVPLVGIRQSGRYLVLRIASPSGFATGVVRGITTAPAPGALVGSSTLPLVALAADGGVYALVTLAGTNELNAVDVATLDAALVSVAVAADGIARRDLTLQALVPAVTSVTPANGGTDVTLGAPVVITFSKPIDPATMSGIVVEGPGGSGINGTRTLSDGNRVITFRPVDAFASNTAHRVRVLTSVQDTLGRSLLAEFSSGFTTIDTAPRPAPPAGAVSATVPASGQTTVRGTQGTAGLHDTVRIHNLTRNTFQVALVAPNGSFEATLAAQVTDRLRISITTPAGVETTVDLARFSQQNADGSVSSTVGAEGGVLDGPDGIKVDVPDGAFAGGAVITMASVPEAAFPIPLTPAQRTQFSFAGGVRLDFGGAQPSQYLNVSIPARGGETLETRWILAGVSEFAGRQVLAAVDTARVIAGRIQTSSPPCPGVLAAQTYGFFESVRPVGVVYGKFPNPNPWAGARSDAVAQQLLLMATPFLGPELAGAIPYGVTDDFPSLSRNICLPALSGRVTVTPNTQDIVIAGADLTPADREVVIRNTVSGQRFVYPREAVEFRTEIDGALTDNYQVRALTASGESPVGFELKAGPPGRTVVRVDMHAVAVGITAIVVRNLSQPGTEVAVPVAQVDVRAAVSGGGDAAQYSVQVITATGVSRAVPFRVESPFGPGRLVARAIPLTIDPGTRTFIKNLTRDTELEVPAQIIVDGRGGFDFAFDDNPDDRYAIEVRYVDNSRLPLVFAVPAIRVYAVNAVTGARRPIASIAMPPQDEPFNLGVVGGDVTAPFLTETPDNLTFFDPASFMSFRFSEGLDRDSALSQVKLFDAAGREVVIDIRLSEGNQLLTIIPKWPLELGQTYTVRFANPGSGTGLTDGSGNLVANATVNVRTFFPRRIGPTFVTQQIYAPKHLELWRTRDNTNRLRTYALQGKQGDTVTDPVFSLFDFSDSDEPQTLHRDPGGLRFFDIDDWGVAVGLKGVPLSGINPCTNSATFTGDLAVMTRFNESSTGGEFGNTFKAGALDIFDVTKPDAPCRFGVKLLTGVNLGRADVYDTVGYPKAVELMPVDDGVLAFVAVQQVGLMAVDVTKVIGDVPKERAAIAPGNYRDVAINGSVVLALEQSPPSIDVYNAQLARLNSFPLAGEVEAVKLAFVRGFPIDLDNDSAISESELRDMAFVGGARGVWAVDVTDIRNIALRAYVPTPSPVHRIEVDVESRRAIGSMDLR